MCELADRCDISAQQVKATLSSGLCPVRLDWSQMTIPAPRVVSPVSMINIKCQARLFSNNKDEDTFSKNSTGFKFPIIQSSYLGTSGFFPEAKLLGVHNTSRYSSLDWGMVGRAL